MENSVPYEKLIYNSNIGAEAMSDEVHKINRSPGRKCGDRSPDHGAVDIPMRQLPTTTTKSP
jgi:hypothetical protein